MRWTEAALVTLAVGLGACTEYGYTEIKQQDFFRQDRRNAVDLLVVVDNSCSMVEEQQNLARNFLALISTFEEADVDWQIAATTTDVEIAKFRGRLIRGEDEVILRGPTGEIDRVEYSSGWGMEVDVAHMFPGDDLSRLRFSWNDNPDNWCPATTELGETGLRGTPGARNPGCAGEAPWTPPTGEVDEGPRAPRSGDLVITELLTQAAREDGDALLNCEWVEITSQSKDTLDLTQLSILDGGRNHIGPSGPVSFPDGSTVAPYGVFVVGRTDHAACGLPSDAYTFASGFSLMDDEVVVTRDTPFAAEQFSEMVALGTTGSGIEMGLEAARLSFLGHPLTPPVEEAGARPTDVAYYTEFNGAWLRDEAALSLLFVSDEDDLSPYAVDAYIRWFEALKGDPGHRDPSLVTLSAVVGKDRPPNPSLPACESPSGVAGYALRYLVAASRTGGLTESICDEDFAPVVERLGLTLSGLNLRFVLSRWPNVDTLTVKLYADESTESFVRDLIPGEDFTYEAPCKRLIFTEDQVPPSEHYVVATYSALPPGQVPPDADPECL